MWSGGTQRCARRPLHLEGMCSETKGHRKVQDHKNRWSTHLCRSRPATEASTVDLYPHCQITIQNIEGSTQFEGEDGHV